MLSLIQGIFILLLVALMFKLSLLFGGTEKEARTKLKEKLAELVTID